MLYVISDDTLDKWVINNIKKYRTVFLLFIVLSTLPHLVFLENYHYGVNATGKPTDCRNRVCGRFLSHYLAHIVKNQNLLKRTKKKGDINY